MIHRSLIPILLCSFLWGCIGRGTTTLPIKNDSGSSEDVSSPTSFALNILDPTRVTKKPFGILIDKKTSPVQPERFSGYHTGADFETLPSDPSVIPVPAICDGTVTYSSRVNGYGGLLIERCTLGGKNVTVLYGHLAPQSLAAMNFSLTKGQILGRLGQGYSAETDGERKHLHLSIHFGSATELKGYVQQQSELSGWEDPLPFLPS